MHAAPIAVPPSPLLTRTATNTSANVDKKVYKCICIYIHVRAVVPHVYSSGVRARAFCKEVHLHIHPRAQPHVYSTGVRARAFCLQHHDAPPCIQGWVVQGGSKQTSFAEGSLEGKFKI